MRLPLIVLVLLAALAVVAGAGLGSSARAPRATAPVLIAHDRSTFTSAQVEAEPSLRQSRHHRARVLNDTILHASTVLNPSADISKTQFLVGSQGTYDVYSRTMQLLAADSSSDFWANIGGGSAVGAPDAAGLCATNPQGEPSVTYDWNADRWVISEAAYAVGNANKPTGAYVQCVAVSTSSDATGTWSRYVYQVSTTRYPDRATIGVWSDGYYISFNQHDADGTWAGAGALAVERSKMLTGAAAQARYFDLSTVTPGLGGLRPADINGLNQPAGSAPEPYVQMHDDPSNINDRVEVWTFHVDWTAPVTGSTFQPLVNIPLDTGGFTYNSLFSCSDGAGGTWSNCVYESPPPPATQGLPLDPMASPYGDSSDRLPQLGGHVQWAASGSGDQSMSFAATMNVGSNVAGVAWFRIQNVGGAGWTIGARGTYNPDSSSRYLPSAGFDNSGNVALGFVRTDDTHYLTTAYANASAGGPDVDITTTTNRFLNDKEFGGSTSLALDPIDDCTFWFAGPTPLSSGTGLSFKSFTLAGCTASTTQVPTLTADPTWTAPLVREGLTITGNAGTFSNGTSVSYQWRRCDTRGLNCVDITGETATSHVMTAADANGFHTLRFEEIATNANGSSVSVSTATTLVQSIPPVNVTLPAISGTAQVGQTLSTTNGTWTSSSPLSYTYRWRRCSSGVCSNIAGANSSSYLLTSSDVGATVDVVVSAVNTGGGTDANAVATSSVSAAPVSSGGSSGGTSGGGSSGGGGGGGAGSPDLALTVSAPATANLGDTITASYLVTDKNLRAATKLVVTLSLPTGLSYAGSYAARGAGCTASGSQVACSLDYVSANTPTTPVQVFLKVTAAGTQTVAATATSDLGDLSSTDNTVSFSVTQASASSSGGGTTTAGAPTGINGSGTSTTKKVDKKIPTSHAISSKGKRGGTAKLRFSIYDDSGVAKATATVKRNGKTVATAKTGFGPVAYGSVYYVGWRVPRAAPAGRYTFCVVATDRAAHRSKTTCAPLALK